MNTVSTGLRGPNLLLALFAFALVLGFLVIEHVYEWPFPVHPSAR